MINVITDTDPENNYGITAMPFNINGSNVEFGSIVTQGKPVVKFKDNTASSSVNLECNEITYAAQTSSNDFVFNFSAPTGFLNELRSEKIYSSKEYNVFPNSTTNGLQFVLSFQLEAEDTGEIITVQNARVNIPAEYTNWDANHLYTYIFKITKDTNGTTSTTIGASPKVPIALSDTPALYPIVFDQLTVADMTDGATTEYTLYDSNNPTATDDIFNSDPAVKDYATVQKEGTLNLVDYLAADYQTKTANLTFESDDDNIATVTNAGVVTGVAGGQTSITVTYTNGETEYKDTIIVTVIDTAAFLKADTEECELNAIYNLQNWLLSGYNLANVTWYIGDVELTTTKETDDYAFVATTDPLAKTIKFLKVDEKYICKAVYNNGSDPAQTAYFKVTVVPAH